MHTKLGNLNLILEYIRGINKIKDNIYFVFIRLLKNKAI